MLRPGGGWRRTREREFEGLSRPDRLGAGRVSLVNRIVVDMRQPPEVVTVYRTSKISKYWR